MSVAVLLTFVGCWTPYYLLGLWYRFRPEMLSRGTVPPALSHILFLFGLFNTCLDPLVYGLFTVRSRGRRRHRGAASAIPNSAAPNGSGGAGKRELGVPGGGGGGPKGLRDTAQGGAADPEGGSRRGGAQLGFNKRTNDGRAAEIKAVGRAVPWR